MASPIAALAKKDLQWLDAFCADAMLLKRPLFVKDGVAIASGFRNETAIEA